MVELTCPKKCSMSQWVICDFFIVFPNVYCLGPSISAMTQVSSFHWLLCADTMSTVYFLFFNNRNMFVLQLVIHHWHPGPAFVDGNSKTGHFCEIMEIVIFNWWENQSLRKVSLELRPCSEAGVHARWVCCRRRCRCLKRRFSYRHGEELVG